MAANFKRLMADSREMSRRSFFAMVGWGAFTVASLAALWESLNFMNLPRTALYEEPAAFKAGPPGDYGVGSTTVLTDKRVVINRDQDGWIYHVLRRETESTWSGLGSAGI